MSGGSYNYLCFNTYDLAGRQSDIQDMANRLESSGYYAAARATRNVMLYLKAAEKAAEALEDVWRAVEWTDSGDWGEEQVVKATTEFKPWPPENLLAFAPTAARPVGVYSCLGGSLPAGQPSG